MLEGELSQHRDKLEVRRTSESIFFRRVEVGKERELDRVEVECTVRAARFHTYIDNAFR